MAVGQIVSESTGFYAWVTSQSILHALTPSSAVKALYSGCSIVTAGSQWT